MTIRFGRYLRLSSTAALVLNVLAASCSSDSGVTGGGGVGGGGVSGSAGRTNAGSAGMPDGGSEAGSLATPGGSAGEAGRSPSDGGDGGVDAVGGEPSIATGGSSTGEGPGGGGSGGGGSGGGGSGGGGSGGGSGGGVCNVGSDCALTQTCTGGQLEKRCIAKGAACKSDSDCHAYEYCAANGACTMSAALGQQCSPRQRCGYKGVIADQLYCDYATMRCKEAPQFPCVSCDYPYVCPDGTGCAQHSHQQSGCANVPEYRTCVSVTQYGQVCTGDGGERPCYNGGRCKYDNSLNFGETYCIAPAGVGQPCDFDANARFCAPGLHCELQSDRVGVCVASPNEGEDCLTPASAQCAGMKDSTQCSPCAIGLYCSAGKCTHYAAAGDDCSARTCADALYCVDVHVGGSCTP